MGVSASKREENSPFCLFCFPVLVRPWINWILLSLCWWGQFLCFVCMLKCWPLPETPVPSQIQSELNNYVDSPFSFNSCVKLTITFNKWSKFFCGLFNLFCTWDSIQATVALKMLGKWSTTDLYSQPLPPFYLFNSNIGCKLSRLSLACDLPSCLAP